MVPCLFVFGGVFYREILMDLNDSEGDRRNRIWTLPVVFGEFAVLMCMLFHKARIKLCRRIGRLSAAAAMLIATLAQDSEMQLWQGCCCTAAIMCVLLAFKHLALVGAVHAPHNVQSPCCRKEECPHCSHGRLHGSHCGVAVGCSARHWDSMAGKTLNRVLIFSWV